MESAKFIFRGYLWNWRTGNRFEKPQISLVEHIHSPKISTTIYQTRIALKIFDSKVPHFFRLNNPQQLL